MVEYSVNINSVLISNNSCLGTTHVSIMCSSYPLLMPINVHAQSGACTWHQAVCVKVESCTVETLPASSCVKHAAWAWPPFGRCPEVPMAVSQHWHTHSVCVTQTQGRLCRPLPDASPYNLYTNECVYGHTHTCWRGWGGMASHITLLSACGECIKSGHMHRMNGKDA